MQSGDGELKLGGLGAQRDFVDVRDVARAVHAASLSAAQGVINIGSGRAVRLRDAAGILARVAGYGGALNELDGLPHPGPVHATHTAHATHLRATIGHPRAETDHHPAATSPAAFPYPDGCGAWQQADVRTARDRLGWRPRINLEESLADIWMEAACRI